VCGATVAELMFIASRSAQVEPAPANVTALRRSSALGARACELPLVPEGRAVLALVRDTAGGVAAAHEAPVLAEIGMGLAGHDQVEINGVVEEVSKPAEDDRGDDDLQPSSSRQTALLDVDGRSARGTQWAECAFVEFSDARVTRCAASDRRKAEPQVFDQGSSRRVLAAGASLAAKLPAWNDHAATYWITSSARSSNDLGRDRPSALAVLAFKISRKVENSSTGNSEGFVPCRMRATK
jgi:hypothetical protein